MIAHRRIAQESPREVQEISLKSMFFVDFHCHAGDQTMEIYRKLLKGELRFFDSSKSLQLSSRNALQRSAYKRPIFDLISLLLLAVSSAMARTLLVLAGVSSLAALISAQCATSDNAK